MSPSRHASPFGVAAGLSGAAASAYIASLVRRAASRSRGASVESGPFEISTSGPYGTREGDRHRPTAFISLRRRCRVSCVRARLRGELAAPRRSRALATAAASSSSSLRPSPASPASRAPPPAPALARRREHAPGTDEPRHPGLGYTARGFATIENLHHLQRIVRVRPRHARRRALALLLEEHGCGGGAGADHFAGSPFAGKPAPRMLIPPKLNPGFAAVGRDTTVVVVVDERLRFTFTHRGTRAEADGSGGFGLGAFRRRRRLRLRGALLLLRRRRLLLRLRRARAAAAASSTLACSCNTAACHRFFIFSALSTTRRASTASFSASSPARRSARTWTASTQLSPTTVSFKTATEMGMRSEG